MLPNPLHGLLLVTLAALPAHSAGDGPDEERTTRGTYELRGTSEPGTTLQLHVNGQRLTEGKAGPEGAFSFPGIRLEEGLNVLTVIAADAVGNTTVAEKRVFADTVAPPWRFVSPAQGYRTAERQVTIVGETEPGTIVALHHDGRKHTEAIIPNTGRVYFHVSNLAVGRHRFDVFARDSLGNVTADTLILHVKELPTVELVPGWTGDTTRERNLVLHGASEVGATVTLYDNDVPKAALDLEKTGQFRFWMSALRYGPHRFEVEAKDDLGNEARAEATVTVMAPDPTLEVLGKWDPMIIQSRGVVLDGRANPGATISLSDNALAVPSVTANGGGRFAFVLIDLAYGDHTLELATVNESGEETSATAHLRVVRPLLLSTPKPETTLNRRRLSVAGSAHAEIPVVLYVNGERKAETTTSAEGGFSFRRVRLAEGQNVLRVEALPGNDLRQEVRGEVEVDSTPPALRVEYPAPGTRTVAPTTTVLIEAEPGSRLTVAAWNEVIANRVVPENGAVVVTDLPLRSRPVLIKVIARDAAGNKSEAGRWVWRGISEAGLGGAF